MALATVPITTEMIPLERIRADRNIRTKLSDVEGLAKSIRRHGVLTAVLVARREDGDFDLVAGFRRHAAAAVAGLAGDTRHRPGAVRRRRAHRTAGHRERGTSRTR